MRHAQSQALHAYWQTRRQGGAAPHRTDIEPQDIARMLGYVFILWRADPDHHIFRLAGTHLCDLYQREFRDQNFLSLWRSHDRTHVQAVLEASITGTEPASLIARTVTMDRLDLPVEISLLRGRPAVRTVLQEVHPPLQRDSLYADLFGNADTTPRKVANDQ